MLLAALAALVGAAVQSATGFGFALVLSPALFAVMEPTEAVTALLLLGVVLNVLVLLEGHDVRRSLLPPLILPALPGLVLGAALLAALSREPLQVGVGVAVIAAALWQLRDRGVARRLPAAVAGVASGVLTTSISISGPPLVLWLEAQGLRPAEFRATLAALFLALNVLGGAVLLAIEGSGAVDLGELAPLLGLVLIGYALGALAFRRLDQRRFAAVVIALVICTGVASVLAGVL
jgi:uncharacterized membrane protein YfcA